ncbi:uncharacterized protein FOMMEDRAFT_159846 [Fomitiporia mediterranea MF3/22]|uniref:uncharacterized protein n=1 Tax=Fomitiporia mediterranea (strain MF3/22) TaxID=694068 RepID=UPI0004409110|nr:uncharacterized protein FOMMEDRAFT_159846 [Fomitiporia mediterranea MF3/22]EJD00194.1 hypothetical protein FOMMEDRAFT_159846 [Fomitiporia mediterranea MF3/22]
MLELLQEADPWYNIAEGDIPEKIMAHEFQPKPAIISVEHYEIMKKCWKKAGERPSALEMHAGIVQLVENCDS